MSDHPESLKKIVTFIYLCISCVFVCLCTCSGHRKTIRTPSLSWVPGTKVRVVMLGGGKPFCIRNHLFVHSLYLGLPHCLIDCEPRKQGREEHGHLTSLGAACVLKTQGTPVCLIVFLTYWIFYLCVFWHLCRSENSSWESVLSFCTGISEPRAWQQTPFPAESSGWPWLPISCLPWHLPGLLLLLLQVFSV